MRVIVNGVEQTVPDGTSVAELIRRMGLGHQACAAEVNKSLVPRREQEGRALADGDSVELVTLVGGG
jgi:thiamine biosynthesis protein ThiS